jgi:hypothetical protein
MKLSPALFNQVLMGHPMPADTTGIMAMIGCLLLEKGEHCTPMSAEVIEQGRGVFGVGTMGWAGWFWAGSDGWIEGESAFLVAADRFVCKAMGHEQGPPIVWEMTVCDEVWLSPALGSAKVWMEGLRARLEAALLGEALPRTRLPVALSSRL